MSAGTLDTSSSRQATCEDDEQCRFAEVMVASYQPGDYAKLASATTADLTAEDREVRKATPLGRWGGEMEIAKAVVSLVETDFITGECIRVDGGRHVH